MRSEGRKLTGLLATPVITEEVLTSVEHSKNLRDRSARQQIMMTLGGAGLIVLSFMVFASTSVWTFMNTEDTLTHGGIEIRRRMAQSVNDEVGAALKSIYQTSRSLSEQADVGHALHSKVWPPTPETFETRMSELIAHVNVPLEVDLKLRTAEAEKKNSSLIAHVGLIWGLFAYKADMRTPATNIQECAHVFQAGATALEIGADGSFSYTDAPLRPALVTAISTDENGTKSTQGVSRFFDSKSKMLYPFALFTYELPCINMLAMWARPQAPQDGAFANDWWYIPGGTDQYNSIFFNSPITTADGRKEFGYVGTGISMTDSIGPVLQAILEDGGEFTRGAHLAMVSESGRLTGASEFDDVSAMLDVKEDVPKNSSLGQAFMTLGEKAGSVCPNMHFEESGDDWLIDSLPFHAEDYGMPPLGERWCVIVIIPRDNVYEAFDNAVQERVVTGIINIGVFVCAVVLLIVSLFLALQSDRALKKLKLRADLRKVIASVKEVQALNCPMVLVSSKDFMQFTLLESYESLRDRGALVVLDSIEDIVRFKLHSMILFFSHQWLNVNHPDEKGIQLTAMKGAIESVVAVEAEEREIYVWCDYTSIAQKHKKMQNAAILSLPVYARVADKFIVAAPPAIHGAHRGLCDLDTYNKRGWCRAEMLAKACGSGIDEMYTCCDEHGTLNPITSEDLSRMSFKIFEGQFSVEEDVEILVRPVLGLYSLVLREKHLPHMQVIHAHIEKDKEQFFPRTYLNSKSSQRVELFGKCVSLMESSVKNNANLWNSPIALPRLPVTTSTADRVARTVSEVGPKMLRSKTTTGTSPRSGP